MIFCKNYFFCKDQETGHGMGSNRGKHLWKKLCRNWEEIRQNWEWNCEDPKKKLGMELY